MKKSHRRAGGETVLLSETELCSKKDTLSRVLLALSSILRIGVSNEYTLHISSFVETADRTVLFKFEAKRVGKIDLSTSEI